ncbi:hypothetical protein B0H14DRAFT_3456506 [Mycena olivaceomarginata]|nr:hypothetical protein B0H14DRAFT_3456506 [Mycena olivaceomarginata]
MAATIESLAVEILSEIFLLTLPTYVLRLHTPFPSPQFITPSPSEAPMLLCQVSSPWRTTVINDPRLWRSLCTDTIRHPQLVERWLDRATNLTLSLRIARPLRESYVWPGGPPSLLAEDSYCTVMHLHLPLLLPRVGQCRHLHMLDSFIPHFIPPRPSTALEGISITVKRSNMRAAEWFSQMLLLAPKLTCLHWHGPPIVAQWGILTHLSLVVDQFGPDHLEHVLESAVNVQHLRLVLTSGNPNLRVRTPHSYHTLPTVTTYNFSGETSLALFLALPNLTHLVMEQWMGLVHDPTDIEDFLNRSQCCITVLEIWQAHFTELPPRLLLNPRISTSLTRLLITACDLDHFLTRGIPETLPRPLILFRKVDRCFQIDNLPLVTEPKTCGVLAGLLHKHLPTLKDLYLDHAMGEELECRSVGSFRLWRSINLRRDYESWWVSPDGQAFQAARATEDLSAVEQFDIPWYQYTNVPHSRPHPTQNRFANTNRSGYQFI